MTIPMEPENKRRWWMLFTGKDLVILCALVSATAFGTWLFLRSEFQIGSGWSDGVNEYAGIGARGIRYAVWEESEAVFPPSTYGAGVNEQTDSIYRPSVSPDGRYLVFAAGERGLNTDLYIAQLTGEVPKDIRPLARVNSAFDDLAPAFGSDALYFASERSGSEYGLDLWRTPYSDGVFGDPEPLGAGVNTHADETDPCPLPGTRSLVFTSDRVRGARTDFDLYRAEAIHGPKNQRAYTVAALPGLNTPFEERDPSVSADGNTLVFASDRSESLGGFDLYRSFRTTEDTDSKRKWLPPEPLVGVNTRASERGPALTRDGFSLYYDKGGDLGPIAELSNPMQDGGTSAASRTLYRADSRELFRIPAPTLSLYELLLLIALFVLALLAFLAKHWRTLDILYRCFLVSMVVHLLLMLYLRNVHPESEEIALAQAEKLFHVRVATASAQASASTRERAGMLERDAPQTAASDAPTRAEQSTPKVASAAAPEGEALTTPERSAENAPSREQARLETSALSPRDTSVRAPAEAFERYSQPAPALVVAARGPAQAQAARAGGDQRPARPSRTVPSQDAPRSAPSDPRLDLAHALRPAPDAPGRGRTQVPEQAARTAGSPELRGPEEPSRSTRPEASTPRFDATDGLAATSPGKARREVPGSNGPRRSTGALTAPAGERAAPSEKSQGAFDTERLPLQRRSNTPPSEPTRGRFEERSDARSPGASVAVRAPSEETSSPAFDPTAGLSGVSGSRSRRPSRTTLSTPSPRRSPTDSTGSPGPQRSSSSAVAPERAAPTQTQPLVAIAPPAEKSSLGGRTPLPPRSAGLERTPYKNRFGSDKLRALEEHGGSRETERAVAQGLAYLASVQKSNGSWGSTRDRHEKYGDVRIGKTGLALLAFLGAGHTPDTDTEYDDNVERAIAFLLGEQRPSGHFGRCSGYGHGIATYALAECYALTRATRLQAPLERSLARILQKQDDRSDRRFRGGWSYYFDDDHVWNRDRWPRASISSWQIMALKSARLSGLPVPDRAFEQARGFLLSAWDGRLGAFRYSHDPDRLNSGYPTLPGSTPASLFALSLLGTDITSTDFRDARRYVSTKAPRDYRYTSDDAFVGQARGNLYFWYYGTLAMFRTGGSEWRRWNLAMKSVLLESQGGNGSWKPISIYSDYAGDDREDRSYATAMCVLTLEIYYRYFTPLLDLK